MAVLHVSEWKIMPEREGIKARERGKKSSTILKGERRRLHLCVLYVCLCVRACVFAC